VVSARRKGQIAAIGFAALALTSCEFDEKTIGVGQRQVVVHAVLDPQPATQVVLVEELLTGRVQVREETPDATDPVVSGGGVPISGARVVITASSGDSAVAVEDVLTRGDGKGAGVYRFRNALKTAGQPDRLLISPGERYDLRVETTDGVVVSGSTIVPNISPTLLNPSARPFNRDTDSLFLQWSAVPQAHRYAIRMDAPRGPLTVFVDSLEYLVSGTLRNFFAEGLPTVFVPGFRQTISVGAVDENYYDYFRSQNNPLTGSGLIDHLQGGRGVFGSYVMMRGQTVNVIANRDEPIEGGYGRFAGSAGTTPLGFTLYIESGTSTATRQVSGNWTATFAQGTRGLIGTIDPQARLTLAMLRGQFANDTVDVLELKWDGLALLGTLRSTGERVDYRRTGLP
jgi:hypothetical protein